MSDCPVVQTEAGKVKGRCCAKPKPSNSKQVYRYASIPFGKPPVGELRFEAPQKAESWAGVRECVKRRNPPPQDFVLIADMMQYTVIPDEFGEQSWDTDEDCLYLDVYTANPDPAANMPVLFWIYGGGFQVGGSGPYDGNVLASLHDVVVVIPNYRVNALGFLSFGKDSPCPGNMGMLDQVLALQWTRDNVRGFGGDPGRVTIFGESAGSISVSCHLASPLSRDLFHRAISHSGVWEFPMLVKPDNEAATQVMLSALNITDKDPATILKKLKQLPVAELIKAQSENLKSQQFFAVVWNDGNFLPENPTSAAAEGGKLSSVPYIVGVNNTEGCGIIAPNPPDKSFPTGLSEAAAREMIKAVVYPMFPKHVDSVLEKVLAEYGKNIQIDDEMRWSKIAGIVYGDLMFLISSIKVANSYSGAGRPTFVYHMTQQLRYSHDPEFSGPNVKRKVDFCEADHADDIVFTFGLPLSNSRMNADGFKFSDDEAKLSEMWMNYVVNFATTGDPNKGKDVPVAWKSYDAASGGSYFDLCSSPSNKTRLAADRMKFWTETLPLLAKH